MSLDLAQVHFETPVPVTNLDDCWFYHALDLPGVGTVGTGNWDLRGRFEDYTGGVDLAGKTVLDVGTASGFLTFEAEKRGAKNIIGFDAKDVSQRQRIPCAESFDPNLLEEWSKRFAMMRNGYWFAHRIFQSRARVIYGDIYRLSQLVPVCDVVIVGQILVHLQNTFSALHQAALCCGDRLVIIEGSYESDAPTAVFVGSSRVTLGWWHISKQLYEQWIDLLGFEVEHIGKNQYRCNSPSVRGDVEVWTFVARRKGMTHPASSYQHS